MKKSRIQNICIHRIKISQEKQSEISEKLTYYHSKAIKRKLENLNLLNENKLNIVRPNKNRQ